MNNFDVYTTTNKAKRGAMFDDFRKTGTPLERQAVKFSGYQPVLNEFGEQDGHNIVYSENGKVQFRPAYVSTWSVAVPRT
jgi:hypothetical protein